MYFGKRILAAFVDIIIVASVLGAMQNFIEAGGAFQFSLNFLKALLLPIYWSISAWIFSSTLGKRLVGLVVVDEGHGKVRASQAFLRMLPYFILFSLPLLNTFNRQYLEVSALGPALMSQVFGVLFFGFVTADITFGFFSNGVFLHDRIARTRVVARFGNSS